MWGKITSTKRSYGIAAAAAAVLMVMSGAARPAQATIDINFNFAGGGPVALGGGNYRFDYNVDLLPGYNLVTGNYFTLFDFAGLVEGDGAASFIPTPGFGSFTVSTPNTGRGVPGFGVRDLLSRNISVTYDGPTVYGSNERGGAPIRLGRLSAISSLDDVAPGTTAMAATTVIRLAPVGEGGVSAVATAPAMNRTIIAGPVAGVAAVDVAPEPGTLALLTTGLLGGLGGIALRRRRG